MGPKGKKGKMSKAEKERLKKEEAERKAREEEELRLKAEQEEREREEREREEEERRRLFEEQERVRHQAEIDELNKQIEANQLYLNEKRKRLMDKRQWDQYMSCDGKPNPICKRDINTYINLTKENMGSLNLLQVLKECELIIDLLDELEYQIKVTELDLNFTPEEDEQIVTNLMNKKNGYIESQQDLRELVMVVLDKISFLILENPDGHIDPDTFNISVVQNSKNIQLCLWGNAAKNPRVKQIEFERDAFTMELPKQMALAEIAVRVLYLKFDFLSGKCESYYYVPPPPPPKVEEIVITEEEQPSEENEDPDTKEETVKDDSKLNELLVQTQPSPAPSNKTMLGVKENRKVSRIRSGTARSAMSTRKADTSMSRLSNINTDKESVKLDDEEVETVIKTDLVDVVEVDEFIMNLRSHNLLGALMYIELIELPLQPKEVNGWIIQQISHEGLRRINYGVETPLDDVDTPNGSVSSISTNRESSSLNYSLPIMLSFSIDERVVLYEKPQVARWDGEQLCWTKQGINDLRYEIDERLVFFRTKNFGPFAVFQNMYVNMPFKSWKLNPISLNQCVLHIHGKVMDIEITVKDELCCVAFHEKPKELQHLSNVWMEPEKLANQLRSLGANFCPYIDGGKYCKTSEKQENFVSAVHQHMAMTSSCFAFSSSQWNSSCGEEKIVVRSCELLGGTLVAKDMRLYMASPRICSELSMNENATEFSSDVKDGTQMHPDLYHMLRENASEKGKQRLQETSIEYIDCVRRLLDSVNLFVFTANDN